MSVFRLRKRVQSALLACSMFMPLFSAGQVVTLISGLGQAPPTDGSQALNVQIIGINGMVCNSVGDIYFTAGNTVRKITANGILETIAGSTAAGRTGDGGPAKQARLSFPTGLALDKDGNLFVSDTRNACVRKIDSKGIITTVAGFGGAGFNGDDTLAIHAQLNEPNALAVDDTGNLYIADTKNQMIRRVNAAGYIHAVGGSKTPKYAGLPADTNVVAREVAMQYVKSMVVLKNGDILYSDDGWCMVRKISASTGLLTHVSGSGKCTSSGDNAPAASVSLTNPVCLTKDKDDNVYVGERGGGRLRKIDQTGLITTVAGGLGNKARSGKADEVLLSPQYISTDGNGNIVIVQSDNLIAYYSPSYGSADEKMLVFPNPCQKFTNVVLPSTFAEDATVFGLDASGRVVVTSTGTTNRNISLYFQDGGVYTLMGASKHGKWSGKVTVVVGE